MEQTIKVNTIDTHAKQNEIIETLRDEWGRDMAMPIITDFYQTLKTLAGIAGVGFTWDRGTLSAGLSYVQRGLAIESVLFDMNMKLLISETNELDDMTGTIWDDIIVEPWTSRENRGVNTFTAHMQAALEREIAGVLTDNYIIDYCMANELYFDEEGDHIVT